MGSSQYGEIELSGGRASGSAGSSRKGKKSSTMERPKQPQRGLGVAQLEKIRIQSQIMSGYTHQSVHPSFSTNLAMVGYGEGRSEDISFGGTQLSSSSRFYPNHRSSSVLQPNHFGPVTLPLMEDFVQKRIRHERSYATASNSQVSDSSNSQELDLELKLSI